MKANKQKVQEATQAFIREIQHTFPRVTVEMLPERFETADVWLEVTAPNARIEDRLSRKLADMNVRYYLETGVYIFYTIERKQPIRGKPTTTAAPAR